MASNLEVELYRTHRVIQDRHTYFLLASAGAGIALAVQQTQGDVITWAHIPLGVSVLCWGLSFYFGCRYIDFVTSLLYTNMDLLKVEGGRDLRVGTNPQLITEALEVIRHALDDKVNRAAGFAYGQFGLLISGAVLYIAWHILKMILRSIS